MINYKKGGKEVKLEDSKVVVDPRSETSFRGKSHQRTLIQKLIDYLEKI